MAQSYDVSLKALFLREGDGIIRRRLFGGQTLQFLPTEQPQVTNRRADLVALSEHKTLHHVEFQTLNEILFGLRMLEYYLYLVRYYGQPVHQTVLYVGAEPLRLESGYTSPSMDYRFEIINLREFDADLLLASNDWADNALALLAKGSLDKALDAILPRLRSMRKDDQNWAASTLVLLSGILGKEKTVNERLSEVGMINVMENKVLGPMIQQRLDLAEKEGLERGMRKGMQQGIEQGLQQGLQQGLRQGMQQGMQAGLRQALRALLTLKFGPLPDWTINRLDSASTDQLSHWTERVLSSTTLQDIIPLG